MVRLHAANFIYQCVQFFSWQTEANCFFRWRKYFANPFISYGRMVYESIYNIWWCRVQYSMDFHGIICMVFITVHHILHNMHKEKPWKKRISEFTMCFVVHEKNLMDTPRSTFLLQSYRYRGLWEKRWQSFGKFQRRRNHSCARCCFGGVERWWLTMRLH